MPDYTTADIRNIALVGHTGSGKTSLAEALLYAAGVTNRLGSVTDGSSHLDVSDEERERKCSLDSALASLKHDGTLINLVDTPGAPGFVGPALASLAAVETVVCVVSAPAGIEVNTRRMMRPPSSRRSLRRAGYSLRIRSKKFRTVSRSSFISSLRNKRQLT